MCGVGKFNRGLRIRVTQGSIAILVMSSVTALTEAEVKETDFTHRCMIVGGYLWRGRSISMTQQQLRYYGVSPHDMITELAMWVSAEEAEAYMNAVNFSCGEPEDRTWVVYCTKVQDKYVFRAKTKS